MLFLLVTAVLDISLWEGKSVAKAFLDKQQTPTERLPVSLSFRSQMTGNLTCLEIVFPPVMGNPSCTSNPGIVGAEK